MKTTNFWSLSLLAATLMVGGDCPSTHVKKMKWNRFPK